MSIDELIQALFGGAPARPPRMSPEDEARASAVLMKRTGPGTVEEFDPNGGMLAMRGSDGTVSTDAPMSPDEEDAMSSSPLRRRSARKNVNAAFGD